MHTSVQMNLDEFDFWLNDEPSSFDNIFPNFTSIDRVGVIVRHAGGGLGSSALLMAATAKFFDFYRSRLGNKPGQLRIYPDFYVFHIGRRDTEYYWMDIWPPHKEVDVVDEPQAILEALNDRAITRLLIPEGPSVETKTFYNIPKEGSLDNKTATFLQETVSSAEQRIETCLIYSPAGRVIESDIKIKSTIASEKNVYNAINDSKELSDGVRENLLEIRQKLLSEGRAIETYKLSTFQEAISMLSTNTSISNTMQEILADLRRT